MKIVFFLSVILMTNLSNNYLNISVSSIGDVCQYNEDCPPNKLCDRLNRRCINPCFEDSCGSNAECFTEDHTAKCRCLPGYEGNPQVACEGSGPNPCVPNPCGLEAMCEVDNGDPICFCPKGMTGNPFEHCVPEGDKCQGNPCGPNSGCRVIQGQITCFCLPGYEGSPPVTACFVPENPCEPSPCGPNTRCNILNNGIAKCTCLPGFIESPNTVRGCVEQTHPCEPNPCGYGAVCDANRSPPCYCPENTVGNPYKACTVNVEVPLCQPGPCGVNSDCYVSENREQCYCKHGFIGDPYAGCHLPPSSACQPNPCGRNAVCRVTNSNKAICECSPGTSGDPTSPAGCDSFECTKDDDCLQTHACVGHKCQNPCNGACGVNANCRVESHHPVCYCREGLQGNPILRCSPPMVPEPVKNSCYPNPCGQNTLCQVLKNRAVCSCLPGFLGDPQSGCHPECMINSDCPHDKACLNMQCVNPCSLGNICGTNAECRVSHHTATCLCRPDYFGNPFIRCTPKSSIVMDKYPNITHPCSPSPCGPFDYCETFTDQVAMCGGCDLQDNSWCRPECLCNSDCPFDHACIGWKCADPCLGTCGVNANCEVIWHQPVCSCPTGLYGNPYQGCIPEDVEHRDPCSTTQCGANAICRENQGATTCECLEGYSGNPFIACHVECVQNSDCPLTKACSNHKCVDPCHSACGTGASCDVINHYPVCFCDANLSGDPFVHCYPHKEVGPVVVPQSNPCDPSPCGPNSRCLISPRGYATCSCLPDFRGSPPLCNPECIVSSDCLQIQACINNKCVNPCNGICGHGALCLVINHNPVCSCPATYEGDPFVACVPMNKEELEPTSSCHPSPCGPNSVCQIKMGRPVCSCQSTFIGSPPNCRPECLISQECPIDQACVANKCIHPCPHSCGPNSECAIINHTPYCSCKPGYEGDAFVGCTMVAIQPTPPDDPCNPSPCGNNAICNVVNGVARCTCIPPYVGNPYVGGCKPECMINSDCANHLACLNQHCRDPCPGICGFNAQCEVSNHIPTCSCLSGYSGDPFQTCKIEKMNVPPQNPCTPSPCGPYSICRVANDRAVCSCSPGYRGTPPSCRPECLVSSECAPHLACIDQKCSDPCQGVCGYNALCQVSNHNPICSCPERHTGDPFVQCTEVPKVVEPTNPCVPSPCGPNAQCRVQNNRPVCSCLTGMFGAPPYCRPECLINQDCPNYLACLQNSCVNPCVGSCGINANCIVRNHRPICQCQEGFEGDPFSACNQREMTPVAPPSEPCNPSPCGSNAVCNERNGAGSCTCLPDYTGDPYDGCRPECVQNSDCPHSKACTNNKCKDPCVGACGLNAQCQVFNHQPSCSCLSGYTGNPLTSCYVPPPVPTVPENACEPSPCGPYSNCRVIDFHAVCSCQPGTIGSPPTCRPECVISTDCAQNKACINQRCEDPCVGTCGLNARCQVINHNPVCICMNGYTGDPFSGCLKEESKIPGPEPGGNPCVPSPCGPNSQCRVIDGFPACSCLPNYVGRAPNCRPECVINEECPGNLACQNERCSDPCPGSCGVNTFCDVVKHNPVCNCNPGFTGNPFIECTPQLQEPYTTEKPRTPCDPSPCGANAVCNERNGAGSCTCIPEYFGDPYTGCRPECVTNNDCGRTKACLHNKCINPCAGTCGPNASCRVVNHAPSCTCLAGYTGDPTTGCSVLEIVTKSPITDPCEAAPCGPNSNCRTLNGHAVCSCKSGFIGTPPTCRPECSISTECPRSKACVNNKCINPCQSACGENTKCLVVNHSPICTCAGGYTGDPFVACSKVELTPGPGREDEDPCVPNPCGPNSQCKVVGSQPACSCAPNFLGRPPNCRPECRDNSECPTTMGCINQRCKNPCPGACGDMARCSVLNHSPVCSCPEGYTGDPSTQCTPAMPSIPEPRPTNPCLPNPCGPNAQCRERNGAGACACPADFIGDPYDNLKGCHRECEVNDDCVSHLACVGFKCTNPCPGTCGTLSICQVENHVPRCQCPPGYTGDPFYACNEETKEIIPPQDPCSPTPCGPNSKCRTINSQAVCTCLPDYIGAPPSCRPECIVNAECPVHLACINRKCADPCPNTCGVRAQCTTKNHNPICTCPAGFTGDPFTLCIPQVEVPVTSTPRPPSCNPSPCGPNSQCQMVFGNPACSCLPNYIGVPPECRPECIISSECKSHLACVNQRCQDPCSGSCGFNAQCHVLNHIPVCTCMEGFTGDPFTECSLIPPTTQAPIQADPCTPSPCGPNAICRVGECTCLPEYFGNPYEECRPECVLNSECPRDKSCLRNKCVDPCPGRCGQNAECDVVNHIPVCSCRSGFVGDPFINCRIQPDSPENKRDPCSPSPCGPNSQCRNVENHAVCSCLSGYLGTPPACRLECLTSSECPPTRACISNKCTDPCLGSCGLNARCEVINHSPICSCPPGQTGDPFRSCYEITMPAEPKDPQDPCSPSPCGPNAQCQNNDGIPACSCLPNYIGSPPSCRPECVINPDCPSNQACINSRCVDPCPGSCGDFAECRVINHAVTCSCTSGYTGNPFVQCMIEQPETINPCEPSPCGPNAICQQRDNAGACVCIDDYHGNPYEGCQPECILSSDCPTNKACERNKCVDPCPGVCGTQAQCSVINHIPTCTCLPGFIGDPFTACTFQVESTTPGISLDPCNPSPCGPNSLCRTINDQAVCTCQANYIGAPPNCRPECVVNTECAQNRACYKYKCNDPCPGTCGIGADCRVINHNPLCSCPAGTTGDPFSRCYQAVEVPPTRPSDPCVPNPCGLNAECRRVGDQAACSCLSNYIGSPPNCRPECVVNTDCPSTQACISEKCRDPCIGSCGQDAECRVQNHIPTCLCREGFTGDAFTLCSQIMEPKQPEDPCNPSPCGANALCNSGVCTCLPEYQGDPYVFCRPECTMNSDCPRTKSCMNQRCVDPCPGTCGTDALCNVVNHIPMCSCSQGTTGNPFFACRPVKEDTAPKEPCSPSPCGPNSICRVVEDHAVCSCSPGFVGSPPGCRPECVTSAECPLTRACLNNKCQDPCPGTCGQNAKCQVVNHNPICSCLEGNTGDPFTRCYLLPGNVSTSLQLKTLFQVLLIKI